MSEPEGAGFTSGTTSDGPLLSSWSGCRSTAAEAPNPDRDLVKERERNFHSTVRRVQTEKA
jgi:hypothetical protein